MIDFCEEKKIPVKASIAKPYSSDENCLHISYEAGKLEDLAVDGVEIVDFGMTVSPQEAPDKVEEVTIGFEAGVPVDAERQAASRRSQMVEELNKIGGRNGVGRIDMVENRFVGMKSRGVYEAPGMTHAVRGPSGDRAADARPRSDCTCATGCRREVAEMVYYGFWYTAKMDALMAFIREAQKARQRRSDAELLQGQHHRRGRTSPNSLYDAGIASMEGGGSYDQTDAEGFLRIQGLPLRVQGRVTPRKY